MEAASAGSAALIFGTRQRVSLQKLRFAWKRFADEIASEPPNEDIFAKLGNFRAEQILKRNARILDEALFEQTDCAVELVEFSIDNFVDNIRRFAGHLRFVNLALGFDQFSRNIFPTDVKRMGGSNVQGDVFNEAAEVFVLGHEIGLAVHFHQHSDFALQMNVRGNDAFLGRA